MTLIILQIWVYKGVFTLVVWSGPKKKMIHLVLVRLAFTLAFLTPNLTIQNQRHQEKLTTWLDSVYDVFFRRNLPNIQNNAAAGRNALVIFINVYMVVFLPAENKRIANKMCEGVKTVPGIPSLYTQMKICCKDSWRRFWHLYRTVMGNIAPMMRRTRYAWGQY